MSALRGARELVDAADRRIRAQPGAVRVAVLCGVVFVPAGLVKFVFHAWELGHFREFGLPWPAALEILAGVLETGGGALLIARVAVAPVALLLAVTMAVAIAYSGIGNGDIVPSLTLAPALLVGLLYLLMRSRAPARPDAAPAALAAGG